MPSRPRDTRLLERWLLGLGVVFLGAGGAELWIAHDYQVAAARQLDALRAGRWAATEAPVAESAPANAHGPIVVGRLRIPRVGLSAMIAEGTSASTLRRAIGHLPESELPGQPGRTVLAGHRDTFFRDLGRLRPGDGIEVSTANGDFDYRVASTAVVPSASEGVVHGGPPSSLTLVTCYPFDYLGPAPLRFVVRAELLHGRAI